jgi:hypothetical protein
MPIGRAVEGISRIAGLSLLGVAWWIDRHRETRRP